MNMQKLRNRLGCWQTQFEWYVVPVWLPIQLQAIESAIQGITKSSNIKDHIGSTKSTKLMVQRHIRVMYRTQQKGNCTLESHGVKNCALSRRWDSMLGLTITRCEGVKMVVPYRAITVYWLARRDFIFSPTPTNQTWQVDKTKPKLPSAAVLWVPCSGWQRDGERLQTPATSGWSHSHQRLRLNQGRAPSMVGVKQI